jgi:hypothetical protein
VLQPLREAGRVHVLDAARALAGVVQPLVAAAAADAAHVALVVVVQVVVARGLPQRVQRHLLGFFFAM